MKKKTQIQIFADGTWRIIGSVKKVGDKWEFDAQNKETGEIRHFELYIENEEMEELWNYNR